MDWDEFGRGIWSNRTWTRQPEPQEVTNADMKYKLSKQDPFHVPTVKEEYYSKKLRHTLAA